MAPPRRTRSSPSITSLINIITRNWKIKFVHECLPKALWPNKQSEPRQWGTAILTLLSQISAIPTVTIPDFRAKVRSVIKTRKEQNDSNAGNVRWVKAMDLKTVLSSYAKDAEAVPEPADPVLLPKETITTTTKPSTRTRRGLMPKTPKTPAMETGDDEPLAGGKYQYLTHVRPVKVNLNPTASAARKPLVARPALRGRKRTRNAEEKENSIPDPCTTANKPGLVHLDPDPRLPDDTGFLSDLEASTLATRKKKRAKRLSRLQVQRVRVPHWQRDPVPTPLEAPPSSAQIEEVAWAGEETDESLDLGRLPEIPESATVVERRQMEELRLGMEMRVWRIRVLKMREREGRGGEVEMDVDVDVDADGDVVMQGRVLRRRKGR
ncbi:hypothetical protein GMOD_00010048 [Pyrenophora seminiperda CCB06]|uniref:Uncharacterized protein n=1 Tax=Pyrenophora seminiperda CCB06 TaxID=1302712 RepID=A0A3M7M1T4_9PLEO|nr:hypothetical protein GMOD_00010048 [Pyrenophora seminiperda CCB06]